jgi:Lon protease-like protein
MKKLSIFYLKKKILFRIDELMFLIFNYRNILMIDWI